jgi:hypothetical protein
MSRNLQEKLAKYHHTKGIRNLLSAISEVNVITHPVEGNRLRCYRNTHQRNVSQLISARSLPPQVLYLAINHSSLDCRSTCRQFDPLFRSPSSSQTSQYLSADIRFLRRWMDRSSVQTSRPDPMGHLATPNQ